MRANRQWPLAVASILSLTFGCWWPGLLGVAWGAGPTPQASAAQVDQLLAKESPVPEEKQAGRTDDETFLRRVSLDLVGELPTPEDVIRFSLDPATDKRAKAVERLLASPLYGQNWGRYWRDVIMYRRSEDRALLVVPALTSYLTTELNKNTPWDQLARSFITATGNVQTEGSTGLIMAQAGRPEETTAEVSRIFLGIQIQCAQCHDHPTDRWKREQFHQLTAFFPRVAARPVRSATQRGFEVVGDDGPVGGRVNNNNRFRGTPEHFMPDLKDPAAAGTRMTPVFFVSGEQLAIGAPDSERRGKLADWLTAESNPWFAKALVNRVWSELVGEGFYEPVDDIGPDRDCVAPETLDQLAADYVASGYDTKWLLKTIIATDAYQRDSRNRRLPNESPFTANCPQRLRADQLYNALTTALRLTEFSAPAGGRGGGVLAALNTPRGQFNQAFGYDPSLRRDEVSGSIAQALLLMNSRQINDAVSTDRNPQLRRLFADVEDDESLAIELYLRTLARQPSERELKTCLEYVAEVKQRNEAFEDILWSLINSTEFLYRR